MHHKSTPITDVVQEFRLWISKVIANRSVSIACQSCIQQNIECLFAILDKSKYNLTRNGSVRVGRGPGRVKYYHFELPKINEENRPYTEGMMYIARAQEFTDKRAYPVLDWFDGEIEEWGSPQPVTPLARLRVSPRDFPYLDQVEFSL